MQVGQDVLVPGCTNGYRQWDHHTEILIENSVVARNRAVSGGCTGGGISVSSGHVRLHNVNLTDNQANYTGGGLSAGNMGSQDSCALAFDRVHIANNVARNGAQVFNGCGGSVTAENNFTVQMGASPFEVVMTAAGNITFQQSSVFQCPQGSIFRDDMRAFGANSVTVFNKNCLQLISSLQFGCIVCDNALYATAVSTSTGTPGQSNAASCEPCPHGGSCVDGLLLPAQGYWGDGENAQFILCPAGYCDPELVPVSPLPSGDNRTLINPCSPHRQGILCGDCEPEYSEVFGSTACVESSACMHSQAVFWPVFVVLILITAVVVLFISGVFTTRKPPAADQVAGGSVSEQQQKRKQHAIEVALRKGTLKLLCYYFQVRAALMIS